MGQARCHHSRPGRCSLASTSGSVELSSGVFLPVEILGSCSSSSLFALWRRDATLDREGGAVGTGDAQRGGIAADLLGVIRCVSTATEAALSWALIVTYFPSMTRCEWWWLAELSRLTEVPRFVGMVDISKAARCICRCNGACGDVRGGRTTYSRRLCWRVDAGTRGGQGELTVSWWSAYTNASNKQSVLLA